MHTLIMMGEHIQPTDKAKQYQRLTMIYYWIHDQICNIRSWSSRSLSIALGSRMFSVSLMIRRHTR